MVELINRKRPYTIEFIPHNYGDHSDLVKLRVSEGGRKGHIPREWGYVPLEVSIDDLDMRASDLGFKIEEFERKKRAGRNKIRTNFRLKIIDDKRVSNFSFCEINGQLWTTNTALDRLFETFQGSDEHFYYENEDVAWKKSE